MISTFIKIFIELVIPKNIDGSFKYGARHTCFAAATLGCFMTYSLGQLENKFYTRREAAIDSRQLKALENDNKQTKYYIYTKIQALNDHWDETKARLNEIKRALYRLEENKKNSALSLKMDKTTIKKD